MQINFAGSEKIIAKKHLQSIINTQYFYLPVTQGSLVFWFDGWQHFYFNRKPIELVVWLCVGSMCSCAIYNHYVAKSHFKFLDVNTQLWASELKLVYMSLLSMANLIFLIVFSSIGK